MVRRPVISPLKIFCHRIVIQRQKNPAGAKFTNITFPLKMFLFLYRGEGVVL